MRGHSLCRILRCESLMLTRTLRPYIKASQATWITARMYIDQADGN